MFDYLFWLKKYDFLIKLKLFIMISKIKYVGIFIGSIGYLMKVTHTGLGLFQGNTLVIIGLFLIATYALAKLFGK
jgi:hypothetical protein